MENKLTNQMSNIAAMKISFMRQNPVGFFISTMMAGAYVAIGVVLIMTLGNEAEPLSRKLIMGCFFGISLTLVVFAGADLFSGHVMYMAFGFFHKKMKALTVVLDWFVCWYGNLFGAMLLSVLFVLGGGGGLVDDPQSLVHIVASDKMNSTITELLARSILCNWLICLAIWMGHRTNSDTAKCILIFWCLFAFVGVGFEHGIANMAVFTISMLGSHPADVNFLNGIYNLFWVSVGNIIGGAGFISVAYYLTTISILTIDRDDANSKDN